MEPKITKTPDEALRILMNRCAKAECCVADVRRSMTRWGMEHSDQKTVIDRLLKDRFIDESRYTAAYVREKINLSRWGVYKIRAALRTKRIAESLIEEALSEVDPQSMAHKLEGLLQRKKRVIHAKNNYDLRGKLLRYGTSLGYDFETVNDVVVRVTSESDYDE